MKINGYKLVSELVTKPPVSTGHLALTPTSQGIRKAHKISQGLDPMHSKPGFKQAASKFLKRIPVDKIKSAGVIK